MLSASAALWLLAQFGLREASYGFLAHHLGLQIPLNEMGAFNLWAWQLVWVVGMWCGVRWVKDDLPVQRWAKLTWIPAAVVVLVFLALRYAQIFGFNLGWYSVFFDKWHLGFARLIDFTALAMVLIRFRPIARLFTVRPLVLMGQSSLHVFCTHFVFCFIGIGMLGDADRLYGWKQAALVVVTFSALLLIARLNARPISGLSSSAPRTPRRAVPSPRPQQPARALSSQAGRP